ncbi:MAG: prepilin-type N-terminal cleavage/methylation domain-containing protein [Candidatus Hydrogenedentota bacterium]
MKRQTERWRCSSGFTLVEMLAALAVAGVAAFIVISLFSWSLVLAQESRRHSMAVGVASELLTRMHEAPEEFVWPGLDEISSGEHVPVEAGEEFDAEAGLPRAMPTVARLRNAEIAFREAFQWEAFARRAGEDAHYVELTVAVYWEARGRERVYTLTSALPVQRLGEAP